MSIIKRIFNKDKERAKFKYKKNRKESLKILQAVTEALDAYGVEYYLDFGTLIGAVRDKGFIPWDDDIDIAIVNYKDKDKLYKALSIVASKDDLKISKITFARSIYNRMFLARRDSSIEVFTKKINFTSATALRVAKVTNYRRGFFKKTVGINSMDIFIKYPKKGKLHWMAQNRVHSIDKRLLETELKEINFYHLKCKIPKNYNAYLTAMYGDWQTPKEDWQYYEHDTVRDTSK